MGADRPRPFAASYAYGLPPARLSRKWNRSRTGCQALLTQGLPVSRRSLSRQQARRAQLQQGRLFGDRYDVARCDVAGGGVDDGVAQVRRPFAPQIFEDVAAGAVGE